jgi:hypothetical protein
MMREAVTQCCHLGEGKSPRVGKVMSNNVKLLQGRINSRRRQRTLCGSQMSKNKNSDMGVLEVGVEEQEKTCMKREIEDC